MSPSSGQLRQPKGVPIGGEYAVKARLQNDVHLTPQGLSAQEATERHDALVDAGYVPAVATRGLDPATTAGIDQWWGDHFVTAEYRASGEGFAQMPDDATPAMTGGNALSGARRTHRVKYRGDDVTLRMPSATAIKRFAKDSGETTFDVPVGGQYPDAGGNPSQVSGWVRVNRSPNGAWTAVGMGFPAGEDEAVAEGVASILEARRPTHALRDAGALIAKHRARLAAQGAPMRSVSSQWISAVGYDDASGVMATQTATGAIYGHLVSRLRFNAVAQAPSPGSAFNKLVKGSDRVGVSNCHSCGRFFAAGGAHSCPAPKVPELGVVRNVAAQAYATAVLAHAPKVPAAAPGPVRAFGEQAAVPAVRTIDTKADMTAQLADRGGKTGYYGKPGWLLDTVATEIAPFTSSAHVPGHYREDEAFGEMCRTDNGQNGLFGFAGLGAGPAAAIRSTLTRIQLAEAQGDGPSLGTVLDSAIAHPGKVEVHGYAVGPDRSDERLTAEGVFIYDDTLTDEAAVTHAAWAQYGLGDARTAPDEVHQVENPWRPGERAWRLWWD